MKKLGLSFILFLSISNLFSWGGLAHRIITEHAMQNLPQEMKVTSEWKAYIIEHCSDPDKRKKETPGEFEKHFIDIDFYNEFKRGEMISSKDSLISKYGEETVLEMGVLPWTILASYENLIKAFEEENRENILFYASDLAHYVGDGSQPLHVILNYDGNLTEQDGIHSRYETRMLGKYEAEIREKLDSEIGKKLDVNLNLIFDYISNTSSLAPIIFNADLHALQYTEEYDDEYHDEYYRLLWFKTEYITMLQINEAADTLASLIYSAWAEAGKPGVK